MHIWAITGGIASGKSTVARFFGEWGAVVHSADSDARAVLLDGSPTRDLVLEAFPEARSGDSQVDRARLAARIFGDPEARARLNAIMHPAIRRRMRAVIDNARADSSANLLLYEVPLLYEGALETWFDGVIAVLASRDAQAARLQTREASANRPPLSDEAIAERLVAQMSPEEKAARADFVVRTDTTLEETKAEVAAVFARIIGRGESVTPIR